MIEHLQRQIAEGVYPSGGKLPSERELAETHKVSRMTARQAVQQLVQNGLAFSRIGKGTFVSQHKIHHELRELTSFTEEMQRRGSKAGNIVLQVRETRADSATAALLQVETDAPIFVLQLHYRTLLGKDSFCL